MLLPFVIYGDFEAITEKIEMGQHYNTQSYTDKYQKHTGCRYGYKVVCCYDDHYTKPVQIYSGEKPIKKFMGKMLKRSLLAMSDKDEQYFKEAHECHICNQAYTNKDIRVRDHCHITGIYRESAHQDCNLKLRINPKEFKIPLIFHNRRGYDSHFIMQEIGSIAKPQQMDINAIPNIMEKYMAFMLGKHLVFLDSFQFMSSSLDRLAGNLPADAFKYTSHVFQGEKLALMKQKSVYPYDYISTVC